MNISDAITHIAKFISGVWQIHAFGEGNTRTTAVFTIKYLRTFGFDISNEAFANHSWYFRNALVRANYNNLSKGIYATTEYIETFFRNLILSENNEIKNRAMLVQESSTQNIQSASGFRGYLKANILNVYEYAIYFAAHESKRISNDKLKNKVILKLSGSTTAMILNLLNGIGYRSVVYPQQTVPGTRSHCLEFTINRLPGIRFFSIWGSTSRNDFPSGKDMDYILKNFF